MVCDKCKGTGLLPFVKDGRVIPHAYLDCDCKEQPLETERTHEYRMIDFDFPMSPDWREFYLQKCMVGQRGPKVLKPTKPDSRQAQNGVDLVPLRVALADLNNKVNRHIDAGKKKGGKFA